MAKCGEKKTPSASGRYEDQKWNLGAQQKLWTVSKTKKSLNEI